jgi:integrase
MGLYKRDGSPFWWFSFKHAGRRIQESAGVTDKRQAQVIYAKRRNDYTTGKVLNLQTRLSLGELLHRYLNDYSKTNKLSYWSDQIAANTLLSFFGDCDISEVTSHRLEQYKAHRRQTLRAGRQISGARVNRELAVLKAVFNKGIEWDMVVENPVLRVKFFNEKDRARTRYLTAQEKKRLLDACQPWLRRIVLVALKTGMRQGEILALKWSDLDPVASQFILRKTKGGTLRHVPIHPDVATTLSALPRRGSYVFCDSLGQPLSRKGSVRSQFEAAVAKAGIRDFRFHDLRHTFASELVMKGVDIKTVADLLGHSTMRMTERYAHLSPQHKGIAINLLDSEETRGRRPAGSRERALATHPR